MNWKTVGRRWKCPNLRYHPSMFLGGVMPTAANEPSTIHIYSRIDTPPTAMMHKQFKQKHRFFWYKLTSINTSFSLFLPLLVFAPVCLLTVGVEVILAPDHSVTYTYSVGLLWTSDQPTHRPLPDKKQHSQDRDIDAPGGIGTRIPSKRAAADPRLGPRGHRERLTQCFETQNHKRGCHI